MASSIAISSISSWILLLCLFTFSEAKGREFWVGGKKDAWKIPSSSAESLNHWAEKNRFQIGDYLVWKYDHSKDSVMEVSKENYEQCNVTNPIKEHKDGKTKVELKRSGPFYFISGVQSNCQKGEKLIVVVLSPDHDKPKNPSPPSSPPHTPPSPSPKPSPPQTPPPSPSPKSPAPHASPPSPTVYDAPVPAPAPEKNGGPGGLRGSIDASPLVVFWSLVALAVL